jgi:hypothetical protein
MLAHFRFSQRRQGPRLPPGVGYAPAPLESIIGVLMRGIDVSPLDAEHFAGAHSGRGQDAEKNEGTAPPMPDAPPLLRRSCRS